MRIRTFAVVVFVVLSSGIAVSCSCQKRCAGGREITSADDPKDGFPTIDYARLKKVDVLGIPFGDTVLSEMRTDRNLGANNVALQDDFVLRFAYLAESFSGDFEKMGFESCYVAQGRDKSDYRDYQSNGRLFNVSSVPRFTEDFWHARHCFFQEVRLPEDVEWKTARTDENVVRFPRVISLFFPNVMTVDLDTNGTWPFGHRPNDQIASRFTALFLKMGSEPGDCSGKRDLEAIRKDGGQINSDGLVDSEKCNLESLNRPSAANSRVHAYKNPRKPAFPINPPTHHYTDMSGRDLAIPEEDFPFLLPPNEGCGYFQSPRIGDEPRCRHRDSGSQEIKLNSPSR